MRRVFSLTLAATFALVGSGCAPSRATLDAADYGPIPKDFKASVNAWLDTTLIDPDSKNVTFATPPRREYTSLSSPPAGWLVCDSVNCRNRLGGYAGRAAQWALIYHDQVIGGRVANGGDGLGLFAPEICRNNL